VRQKERSPKTRGGSGGSGAAAAAAAAVEPTSLAFEFIAPLRAHPHPGSALASALFRSSTKFQLAGELEAHTHIRIKHKRGNKNGGGGLRLNNSPLAALVESTTNFETKATLPDFRICALSRRRRRRRRRKR